MSGRARLPATRLLLFPNICLKQRMCAKQHDGAVASLITASFRANQKLPTLGLQQLLLEHIRQLQRDSMACRAGSNKSSKKFGLLGKKKSSQSPLGNLTFSRVMTWVTTYCCSPSMSSRTLSSCPTMVTSQVLSAVADETTTSELTKAFTPKSPFFLATWTLGSTGTAATIAATAAGTATSSMAKGLSSPSNINAVEPCSRVPGGPLFFVISTFGCHK